MNWPLLINWFAYLLAVTLFVGKIATFSFLIAPIVHSLLEKEQAAKLLRVFFPRYYLMGVICAAVGVGGSLIIGWSAPEPRVILWTILWAYILVVEVFALKFLIPTLEATREGRNQEEPKATETWEWAHKLSVRLNVINLLIGLSLIGLYVRYLWQVLFK